MKPSSGVQQPGLVLVVAMAIWTSAGAVEISEVPLCGQPISVATNSVRLSGESVIYQTRFSSRDWSGQLLALPVRSDGSLGDPLWDAATLVPTASGRNILTCDPGARASCGKQFVWDQLSPSQKTALNTNAGGISDNKGLARLEYLRGDDRNEAPNGENFRARSSLLGDIVNSEPLFVGKQDFGFSALPGSEGSSYVAFRRSSAYRGRPSMVYVGANDGMLHGFDATTGVERFALVPNSVFPRLSLLTDKSYAQNHKYTVDGSARAIDAYIGGEWHTVLVGTLGAGGRGVFALRVTDPANVDGDDVLWEFTGADDPNLGITIPQPSLARMNNGKWAAIVANGYNSAGGHAVLFVLDLETGAVLKRIDTGVSGDNGLSSPIPVDVDADRIADFIYAGDLKGNLWKFDVTKGNARDWDVAFKQGATRRPLFVACAQGGSCTADSLQPITARPEVGLNPAGGLIVYFGTGRYLAASDAAATVPVNTFYAIFDRSEKGAKPSSGPVADRSQLLQQVVISAEPQSGSGNSDVVRITSDRQTTDSHAGWYMDLPEAGERQLTAPLLHGGRVIFATAAPGRDPCGSGGAGWLMELDALTGSRLGFSPFDLNRDRKFNIDDFASLLGSEQETRVPVSGRRSPEGMIGLPRIISSGEIEYKYFGGASGRTDVVIENGLKASGRRSWRQLR